MMSLGFATFFFLMRPEVGCYNPENLELVFEPFKFSRPPNPVPELARDFSADSDNFISLPFRAFYPLAMAIIVATRKNGP